MCVYIIDVSVGVWVCGCVGVCGIGVNGINAALPGSRDGCGSAGTGVRHGVEEYHRSPVRQV